MSLRTVRVGVAVFFAVFTVAVLWPTYGLFNQVRPLILGLPFNLAFVAFWVIGGGLALWVLDIFEERERRARSGARRERR